MRFTQKFTFLYLALIILVAFIMHCGATPTLVGGSPMVVNNTSSNCTITASFAYNPTLQQWAITHNGLNATTDISMVISNTLDQTHFSYGWTWYPATTNAATEYIYAGTIPVTNYVRATIITTNSQSVIINYGQ